MTELKKKVSAVMVAAGLALFAGTAAQAATVLNRGNGGEPSTLDPHRTDGRIESNILRDLFEGLVVYGPDGRILPGVAESWQVSEDGKLYSFQLRADARWSNGDAVTAEDFVYSLRRALTPKDGIQPSSNMRVIKGAAAVIDGTKPADTLGVAAPNPRTVTIALEAATPYFLDLIAADNSALPVHRGTVESQRERWTDPGKMVSNGAYVLEEWRARQQIGLGRNANFHGRGGVSIDKVNFFPIDDSAEEVDRFKAGTLHLTYEVPQDRVKWISLTEPKVFWNRPFLATYYYAFNLTVEPFKSNRDLRRALSLAVNRENIVDKVTRAGETPAYGLVPPIVPNYRRQTADFIAEPMDNRLREARRLFSAAGFSPMQPLAVEILYNQSENNRVIADAVISMWQDAFGKGIQVKPVSVERTDYLKRRARRDFQIVRAAWIGDYADPTVFLNLMLSTALPPRNDPGYRSRKYDDLLAKAAASEDAAQRSSLLGQAEKAMIDDDPVIPIYHFSTKSLVSQQIKGWVYNVRDVHPSRFLSFAEKAAS